MLIHDHCLPSYLYMKKDMAYAKRIKDMLKKAATTTTTTTT
jgi:hypothetical protein